MTRPVPALDDEGDVRHRARKDTKRWCKGVAGREHRLEVRETPWGYQSWWHLRFADVCTVCGKQFNVFRVLLWQPDWHRRLVARLHRYDR
jgi:hypothetical protein